MKGKRDQSNAARMGVNGAMITIAGILLSGPIGVILVSIVRPSLPWQDAETFARGFHWIQTLPFFFGFLLIAGYIMVFAAIHSLADEAKKPAALAAVISASAYAALIFLNYTSQSTFIPTLAVNYRPEYDSVITALSMANPLSLAWSIEMWGYALLGLATWFAAGVFSGPGIERYVAVLMVTNGVISVLGGFVTAVVPGWVLSIPGLVSYVVWNLLVLVLSILLLAVFRRRQTESLR